MAEETITGGCQCGAVRYEVSRPIHDVSHCHCSMCRKAHGALFASFGIADNDAVTFKGEENLTGYESSPGMVRNFCSHCGGQIVIRSADDPNRCFIALGSLDAGRKPGHDPSLEKHIFWESKVAWYDPADSLPKTSGYGD